jgi:hypothetical protein
MVETAVDELADLWILHMIERLRLDALRDLAVYLCLVGAL